MPGVSGFTDDAASADDDRIGAEYKSPGVGLGYGQGLAFGQQKHELARIFLVAALGDAAGDHAKWPPQPPQQQAPLG